MFVRTKEGKILKCFKSESMNLPIYYVIGSKTNSYVEYQDVKKTSENIIDILEVGDYVNGEKITRVIPQDICGDEVLDYQHIFANDREIFKEDIKSIVTSQQFESMSYKVGE